jgi:hypothetical protein
VAGDHRLEVEELPRREGGALHVHGEVAAGAENADLGRCSSSKSAMSAITSVSPEK